MPGALHPRIFRRNDVRHASMPGAAAAILASLGIAGVVTIAAPKAWPVERKRAISTIERPAVTSINRQLKGDRLNDAAKLLMRAARAPTGQSGESSVPKSAHARPSGPVAPRQDEMIGCEQVRDTIFVAAAARRKGPGDGSEGWAASQAMER